MPNAKPKTVVNFYSTTGEHGCFSNFSRHSVFLKGKRWPTTEHYFQAQKFAGEPDEEEIRMAAKPAQAAGMGRDRKRPLRRDWESAKENVMLEALRAKFTQHEDKRRFCSAPATRSSWNTPRRTRTGATVATAAGRTASATCS